MCNTSLENTLLSNASEIAWRQRQLATLNTTQIRHLKGWKLSTYYRLLDGIDYYTMRSHNELRNHKSASRNRRY